MEPLPLQRAHGGARCTHALAAHPTSLRFATVGGDDFVRLWHIGGPGPRARLVQMQALVRLAMSLHLSHGEHVGLETTVSGAITRLSGTASTGGVSMTTKS